MRFQVVEIFSPTSRPRARARQEGITTTQFTTQINYLGLSQIPQCEGNGTAEEIETSEKEQSVKKCRVYHSDIAKTVNSTTAKLCSSNRAHA
jgi:hypothetical protein